MVRGALDTRALRAAPLITGWDTMRPGRSYRRPQGLEDHLLVCTLAGGAVIGPAGRGFAQRAGDLILIEPHHAVDQHTAPGAGWGRIWVIFHPRSSWYGWLHWPGVAPGYRQVRVPSVRRNAPVRRHLEAMHRFATGALGMRSELAMNALEAALLWCAQLTAHRQRPSGDQRVAGAMEFICRNMHRSLTLEEIAEAADLSVPHLARLFRRQVDLTPIQFLEQQRMRRAAQLLQITVQSIASIAREVGFTDPFYFSTRFRRFAGVSPRTYRNRDS